MYRHKVDTFMTVGAWPIKFFAVPCKSPIRWILENPHIWVKVSEGFEVDQ